MSHPSVRKLLIWLLLACVVPGVIGTAILLVYQYRDGHAHLERNTLQTTRALVQAVDNHLLKVQAVAQALASSQALAHDDLALFHRQAREVVALGGLGTNVVLRDETGRYLLNTAVEFGETPAGDGAHIQPPGVFATGKPAISDLQIGLVLNVPIMYLDVPIMRDGKVTHALAVGILPEHFNALLKAQNLPQGWVAAVFDSAGTHVGRTHASEQFVGHKPSRNLFQPMMESHEGSVKVTTPEGTPVWAFYSHSPVTNWRVAIGIPRQELEGSLVQTLSILALGMAALFAIGLVLARWISGRIAHSVTALTAPAIALGNGGPVDVPRVHVFEAAEVASAIARAGELLEERAATLRAQKVELAQAHRRAKFGTWRWDLMTGEVTVSESLGEIFGREISSFRDMRGTLLPEDVWERLNTDPQEVMQTGKSDDLEFEFDRDRGATIWVHSQFECFQNEIGEVVALSGTTQDITVHKCAEKKLQLAKAEADRANNAKSRFLAAASHDLRQPLAALSLYVDTLKAQDVMAKTQTTNMKACLVALNEMLSDLLDLSKLEAGVVTANVSEFDLDAMLSKLLSFHEPPARLQGLTLRCCQFGRVGRTDPVLYQRILGNLISNAIRYTARGGVLVGCRRRQGKMWVEVWDTGIGIPADKTEEIFEEFKQLGNVERSREKGTGLGLAIVAKSAALLGLQLRVQSRPGKGSVFAVELPLGEAAAEVPPCRTYTHQPLRIALVEDNQEVLMALSYCLRGCGHQVVAASSGPAILAALEDVPPDVVISDYRLAGSDDGVEVIAAARANFGTDLPAMIITGDTDPSSIQRISAAGILVRHKPLDVDTLRAAIAELMNHGSESPILGGPPKGDNTAVALLLRP